LVRKGLNGQVKQKPGSLDPLPALCNYFPVYAALPDCAERGLARSVSKPFEIARISLELDGTPLKAILKPLFQWVVRRGLLLGILVP
jgi:hypothetical protein